MLPNILFAQMIGKTVSARTSSVSGITYLSQRLGSGGTADIFAHYNDGKWWRVIQDTLKLTKYPGRNQLTSLDTLLVIENGNIQQTHKSNLRFTKSQITDFPTIPAAQIQPDWNQSNTGALDFIKNKPTRSVSNPVRSFNTSFQVSVNRDAQVQYTITIVATAVVLAGQSSTVFLETSANGTTWQEQDRFTHGVGGIMNVNSTSSQSIRAYVPAGYFLRLRTIGSASVTFNVSQELLL